MTEVVLFDLDGTLIDSLPGIAMSCDFALGALGHETLRPLDIRHLIGPPVEDIFRALLQPYRDSRIDEAVSAYRQHYGEIGLLESTLYPGIEEALAELLQTGRTIYLSTSKREVFARRIVDHLNLTPFFANIFGSVPGGALDEKTQLLKHVVLTEKLSPTDCVMVGDRRQDVVGARAVDMRSVGVLWGYGTREELEIAGADQIIERPADMFHAITSSRDAELPLGRD